MHAKRCSTLPKNVKMSESVNCFKANLENYKVRSLANVFHNSTGHFWDVSGHIIIIIISDYATIQHQKYQMDLKGFHLIKFN